jgi:hypothetical protein
VLGLLHPRWLQKTHHARGIAPQGAGVATGPVKFVVEALRRLDWTWEQVRGRLDRLYIRVHLRWVSRWTRQLLVVTGTRCPLTKPVVTAVELQATTEPHCSRGVQPGGICVYVGTSRADSRRSGPGSCWRQGRKRPLCQLPLWFYIHRPARGRPSQVPARPLLFLILRRVDCSLELQRSLPSSKLNWTRYVCPSYALTLLGRRTAKRSEPRTTGSSTLRSAVLCCGCRIHSASAV